MLKGNENLLSKYKTIESPGIDKYSPRKELFTNGQHSLSYDVNHESLRTQLNLGVPSFKRYTSRKPNNNLKPH